MRCTSRKIFCLTALLLSLGLMTGCGNLPYDLEYHANADISSFNVIAKQETRRAMPFAENICVVTEDVTEGTDVTVGDSGTAALFKLNTGEVIYARNVHDKMYPASLTKVMTALVALENGKLEQVLTATNAVTIHEAGAQLCGLKPGDSMTLDQALRILLINSANDVANLIAENIGGSVDGFVQMMNDKAAQIGATNTNFMNPHGLTDINQYTTAYDMYLIFNEAIKYDTFNEIIHMTNYQTVYYDGNGSTKEFNKLTTNLFLRGEKKVPANVNVIGGKTGTTNAAGHCLILLSRDESGVPYISIVMRSGTSDSLYSEMTELLEEIHN